MPQIDLLRGAKLVHVRVPDILLSDDREWYFGMPEPADELPDPTVEVARFAKGITHNFDRSLMPHGARLVALISTNGSHYCALALVRKEARSSTFQNRVRLHRIRRIEPIPLNAVTEALPRSQRVAAARRQRLEIASFTGLAGTRIIAALVERFPRINDALTVVLEGLSGRKITYSSGEDPWQVVAEEKDAVDTALKLVGHLGTSLADRDITVIQPAPFLKLLGSHALEDSQIQLDAEAFGGFERLRADARGARIFRDTRTRSIVTVINVNRTRIETTTGVDLVVYFDRFQSYLLVQYKRMRIRNGLASAAFWPSQDGNFEGELRAMLGMRSGIVNAAALGPLDYRLSSDPFYFKFCRSDSFEPDRLGMVKGLYLPAADVDHFLRSTHSLGTQGGRRIDFEGLGRQFSNTLFVLLAQCGWIGSRSLGSSFIESYVDQALNERRSVTLAKLSNSPDQGSNEAEVL